MSIQGAKLGVTRTIEIGFDSSRELEREGRVERTSSGVS